MLQCRVSDGTTVSKFSNTTEFTVDCVGRASRPWKILHYGIVNRISKLVKDSLGYMTHPGNYRLCQTVQTCELARHVSEKQFFTLAKQGWPDFICFDAPHTFGYMERYFTEEVWDRIFGSFNGIPVFTFDMQDLGNYSSMLQVHPLFKKETLRFKREVWDAIENYPVDASKPIPVWLGPSCQIHKSIPWNQRSWDIFFWCNDTSKLRVDIFNAFKKSEFWTHPKCIFYLENFGMNDTAKYFLGEYGDGKLKGFACPSIPYEIFGRVVADSKVLCAPDGFGQFTHRHVEGLLSGAAVISSPSLSGAQVPMKDSFFVVEKEEDWPACAHKILAVDSDENMAERLAFAQNRALAWYSVTGFSSYLGSIIENHLIKKS